MHSSLSSRIRPLQGGTSVEATNDDGTCTIGGVLVDDEFGDALITASHCTDIPPFVLDDECPSGKTCRKSDAALIDIDPGVGIDLSKIAKPLGTGTAVDHADTLHVFYAGDQCPWISISTWSCPFLGRPFEIVGRASGRETGTYTVSCSDEPAPVEEFGPNTILLCQGGAEYAAADGDSGAPVFLDKGPYGTSHYIDQVRLFGMHWGGEIQGNTMWFSWIWAIRDELGDGTGSTCAGMDFVDSSFC